VLSCLSIVATETSSLTFLSIPGLAYISNMGFLQVALGYVIGRILVALILVPEYMKGNLSTVYQFLENCFGRDSRRIVSVIFHITRILSDSVRLFITSVPLTVLMGWDYRISILIIAAATFFYTIFGGIKAVIITDAIQFILYLFCAFAGIYIISDIMGQPVAVLFNMIPADKLAVFSTGTENGFQGIFKSYNIFSGIIGGAFLSFASHGTDHLIVQRVLSCKEERSAKLAIIYSGVIVFIQFALFMLFGLFIMLLIKNKSFGKSDEIVSYFIIEHLSPVMRGVMLAGILAAAMSTLSSSINSLSASTVMDLLRIDERGKTEEWKMRVSKLVSLVWSVVMAVISLLFSDVKNPLVEIGLSIASVFYGGMLGLFLMGRFIKGINDKAALGGMMTGIVSVTAIALFTKIFWPWYVCIGFIITFGTGLFFNRLKRVSYSR
jgi:SSS family transporter